jgi:hypothetical protein
MCDDAMIKTGLPVGENHRVAEQDDIGILVEDAGARPVARHSLRRETFRHRALDARRLDRIGDHVDAAWQVSREGWPLGEQRVIALRRIHQRLGSQARANR